MNSFNHTAVVTKILNHILKIDWFLKRKLNTVQQTKISDIRRK